MLDIIDKKRLGESLTKEEIEYVVKEYTSGNIPDYQMSALLMAICLNGMNEEETINLTDIFIKSGDTYKFNKPVCDKHSTGGIGDTVTFVIAPILGALNIPICKMSGRGLGITGGTIDKLETLDYITDDDDNSKEEYYKMDRELLIMILKDLEKNGKCSVR